MVKQRHQQQLGNLTSPGQLHHCCQSIQGPFGVYLVPKYILHGRWFRLWEFVDTTVYVPKDMTQYTIGNPLDLLASARYTIDAFLDAPLRLLVIDTADGSCGSDPAPC